MVLKQYPSDFEKSTLTEIQKIFRNLKIQKSRKKSRNDIKKSLFLKSVESRNPETCKKSRNEIKKSLEVSRI